MLLSTSAMFAKSLSLCHSVSAEPLYILLDGLYAHGDRVTTANKGAARHLGARKQGGNDDEKL